MLKSWLKNEISKKYKGIDFDVLVPPNPKMGDYSINITFEIGKRGKRNPMEIGQILISELGKNKNLKKKFQKMELISPGFINFFIHGDVLKETLGGILKKDNEYGSLKLNKGKKINLEFVSANPTGPLTVANVRAASFGDTLGNILRKTGASVTKEYYINNIGIQVRKFAESVAKRVKEINGEKIEFGEDLYQGEYVKEIAREFNDSESVPDSYEELILKCQPFAVSRMIESARNSTNKLQAYFDVWFSEKTLHDSGEVKKTMHDIEKYTYEKDGAKWFQVSNFVNEKDAVIEKSDGTATYLMNDIAYTKNKLKKRKFDLAINVWGADHHSDVPRLLAGAKALGLDGRLQILLHQLVSIKRKDKLQRMSKRKGEFVLLDDLLNEVGKDAVRFFFLTKDLNTHIEFDVDLAKEQSKQNPVYYIQYALARLNSVFEKAKNFQIKPSGLELLREKEEENLIRNLVKFPDIIEEIAVNYSVHHLSQYVLNLASIFHRFYETSRIIQGDKNLQMARLALAKATHTVLKISLNLVGISIPERM